MTYDETTNSYVYDSTTINGYALQSSYNVNLIDNTNILAGDVKIMAYLESKPEVNDTITLGSSTYTIISITPLCPNGVTNLYYAIQGR